MRISVRTRSTATAAVVLGRLAQHLGLVDAKLVAYEIGVELAATTHCLDHAQRVFFHALQQADKCEHEQLELAHHHSIPYSFDILCVFFDHLKQAQRKNNTTTKTFVIYVLITCDTSCCC